MPIIYAALAGLVTGIFACPSTAVPPNKTFVYLGAWILMLCLAWCLRRWRLSLIMFTAAVWLGAAVSSRVGTFEKTPADTAWAARKRVSVEGVVRSLPDVKVSGRRSRTGFVLEAERILYPKEETDSVESLSLEELVIQAVSGRIQVFIVNASNLPRPGDRVRVFGGLRQPHGPLNPGEMDYGAYLQNHRILAIFSGIGPAALRIVEPDAVMDGDIHVQRIRGALALRFEKTVGSGERNTELLKALILGIRGQFPRDLWQVMMRTGTSHIVSISGLHMSVLSAFVYSLLLLLLRSQRKAAAAAAAVLVIYMFIAGRSIPVQRAAFMGTAVYAAILARREVQPMRLLAWAAFIQLAHEPRSLESISFQLSFLSVFILLLMSRLPPVPAFVTPFKATALVLAGTLPLAAWHFHVFSWSALFANLWAIPFFNFSLVAGAALLLLADIPGLNGLIARLCVLFLETGFGGLQILSQWRLGWTFVAHPPLWKVGHYYLWACGWFLAAGVFRDKIKRWLRWSFFAGWMGAGCLFFTETQGPSWSMTALAGTRLPTVHIQSGSTHWLINAGQSSRGYDTDRRVLPYLKWKGVRRVESIMLTDYPKDVDPVLKSLEAEGVEVTQITGPAPRTPHEKAFLSGKTPFLWRRASYASEFQWGPVKLRAMCGEGRIKMIEMNPHGSGTLFLITELDDESMSAILKKKTEPVVLIFYGSAGGTKPALWKSRRYLKEQMPRAVWVFAQAEPDDRLRPGEPGGSLRSYSLKDMGALKVTDFEVYHGDIFPHKKDRQAFYLQFHSGQHVAVV